MTIITEKRENVRDKKDMDLENQNNIIIQVTLFLSFVIAMIIEGSPSIPHDYDDMIPSTIYSIQLILQILSFMNLFSSLMNSFIYVCFIGEFTIDFITSIN